MRLERGELEEVQRGSKPQKRSKETPEQHQRKNVTSGLGEVRRGKGAAGLVQGIDERRRTDETSGKGKGERKGGKEEHGNKGGSGSKGARQNTRTMKGEDEKDERARTGA